MKTFRKKILITDVILFLIFMACLFPFVNRMVSRSIKKSLEARTGQVLEKLHHFRSTKEAIRYLKDQESYIFFRVTLLTPQGKVLYDSHVKNYPADRQGQKYLEDHPEVVEAIRSGSGYTKGLSDYFKKYFFYIAKSFVIDQNMYVLRSAFLQQPINDLTDNQ